ncbi:hypothetical protein KW800_03280 [Candidatus Parcubacteria bacterium]|nr:hypothetical protein [Candidatus Parcubacteria bacterium]
MLEVPGVKYFHSEPFSKMEEFSILNALRKFCRVLDRGISVEPKGITIITEKPVDEKLQKTLGLIPLEDL